MERHTRSYLQLIKPGITLSNTLTGIAGFFLAASTVGFNMSVFIGAVAGIALVIASACTVNNVIDRKIDVRMKRTSKRAVVSGEIPKVRALWFAAALGSVGFVLLLALTNVLTFLLGVVAFIWYVGIYGIAKRTTALSTIIGGVPGALPPVAGYTALTGSLDGAALALFLILFFWQLPHFYAISIFRRDDYANAKLPVWAVRYGTKSARLHILVSIVLYSVSAALLFVWGYVGIVYLFLSTALSLYWLGKAVRFYQSKDDIAWARMVFGISLMVLLSMILLISIGGYLP